MDENDNKELDIAPAERIVYPGDVYDLKLYPKEISIIGTQMEKVTKIGRLELDLTSNNNNDENNNINDNSKEKNDMNIVDSNDNDEKTNDNNNNVLLNVEEIVLRSCLISKMEGLEGLSNLIKLELYDNQIHELECLEYLPNLRILDMSFNLIKSTSPLTDVYPCPCPHLEEIYLANNKIKEITGTGLTILNNLRIIDLGANKLRQINFLINSNENNILSNSLKELWLGKNKIENMNGIQHLISLRRLDIQSNRLTSITNLNTLINLEELYLAFNGIESIDINQLPSINETSLNTIDLGHNRLTSPSGLENQIELEEIWMNSNNISNFDTLQCLSNLNKLDCLYLEHNPIASEFEYRIKIAQMFNIKQLDATPIIRNNNNTKK